jgi:hypothetical protein
MVLWKSFFDFQGLWKGRKTAPSFSGLSISRHFHGLLDSGYAARASGGRWKYT